ncbi:TnsA-like heteromeric transposase endonuclease subunit [Streptomyces griseus]|uniref:TnsA-like heteromeric transposase endonuclease subunit n=1 Tax=Streptomyces griseus TaxID=1911 RepID=UPI0038647C06|nr:TnsA-like heteromeric transposase endonuclease subunit [Streptomyces fimicarius]
MDLSSATVSVRSPDGGLLTDQPWSTMPVLLLEEAVPWRSFRWYRGQKHYSGTYWSSTTRDHVIYESRLELARLLYADFDRLVRYIVAQPFLLKAVVDGEIRRHVPDFLLVTGRGLVIVDVKPRSRREVPAVVATSGWTRELVEARGWRYELWSEPPPGELSNIRFLAGYRRTWLLDPDLIDALQGTDLEGMPLGQAVRLVPRPEPLVRATIYHLLWTRQLDTDLTAPLGPSHRLRRPA